MKFYLRLTALLLFTAITLLLTTTVYGQASPPPDEGGLLPTPLAKKNLYPPAADATKEIEAALKRAGKEHKRVLLVFGGNWCYDCHVLDRALHEGVAGEIMRDSFVLVHVNVGDFDKNLDLTKKYNTPIDKGVPAVAILGSDGTLVYSSGNGEFEAARTMMRKELVAFLKRWQEEK